jgi:hypothetical protein
MDVETAFLYGDLEEEIWMEPPEGLNSLPIEGMSLEESDKLDIVLKLKKSLYGLKQAPRVWYEVLYNFLLDQGFRASTCDPSVFIKVSTDGNWPIIIAVYVDDLLIVGPRIDEISLLKIELANRFNMVDMGKVRKLLGMEIHHLPDGSIFINQEAYVQKIIRKYGLNDCKGVDRPMFEKLSGKPEPFDRQLYQEIEGALGWPALGTRPDIAQAVSYLGRFNHAPLVKHHKAQKVVLRYLKDTVNWGILYRAAGGTLRTYSDSDWAGDEVDRKSTSGQVVMMAEGAVIWSSTKQKTVANSTVEAEYVAVGNSVKEALWVQQFLKDLGIEMGTIPIYMDSNGAIDLAKNAQYSARTKHIDIRHHFIRDHLASGKIKLCYIKSEENTADIFTKSLKRIKFEKHREGLGMVSLGMNP